MADLRKGAALAQIQALLSVGTVAGMTDGQLLERFATGRDQAGEVAFAGVVARHGPMVLNVCHRLLADTHDAEDTFQATFLVLARKARSIRNPELLGNWLYGVALRLARDARSRSQRQRRHERRAAMDETALDENVGRPDIMAEQRNEAEAVHEEIGRLPEKYRQAVALCDLGGLTQAEAAQRLRWPAGTVSVRLLRGASWPLKTCPRRRGPRWRTTWRANVAATTADAAGQAAPPAARRRHIGRTGHVLDQLELWPRLWAPGLRWGRRRPPPPPPFHHRSTPRRRPPPPIVPEHHTGGV